MYTMKHLTNEEAAKFFLSDFKLASIGLTDESLLKLHYRQEYDPGEESFLFGIHKDDELIAVFTYLFFTKITLNCHCYVKSQYQGKDSFPKLVDFMASWIRDNIPLAKRVIAMSPASCKHVARALKRGGFTEEGRLKNSIEWRYRVTDLLIFGMELY